MSRDPPPAPGPRWAQRLRSMRFDAGELSGALGDLGTFLPLAASLIAVCGLDAGSVLVFAGLFNVVTGLFFNQPIPVQPMKAIAAVAIAEGLTRGEVAAAGFGAGVAIGVLALTGAVQAVERRIPRPVVRGIQLGVGLKLLGAGIAMILATSWSQVDGRVVAVVATLGVLAARGTRFPVALVIFAAGLAWVAWTLPDGGPAWGWRGPAWVLPTAADWSEGLLRGTVPQVPLTLLNSVIAVCALSGDLFPGRAIPTRAMALSVSWMNVSSCLLGAMPACHGSGGLAAQYRFGARTGGSVVVLGLAKMAAGIGLGAAAMTWLATFPQSLLGVLLAFAGVELALPARDCRTRSAFFVAVATAGAILAVNTLVGVGVGLVAGALLRWTSAGDEEAGGGTSGRTAEAPK